MHKGTNKILPNMCAWAHLEVNLVQRTYVRTFLFCAHFRRNSKALLQVRLENWLPACRQFCSQLTWGPSRPWPRNAHGFSIAQRGSWKGVCLPSECLLESPFLEPLLRIRALLTFLLVKPIARHLLSTLLRTLVAQCGATPTSVAATPPCSSYTFSEAAWRATLLAVQGRQVRQGL